MVLAMAVVLSSCGEKPSPVRRFRPPFVAIDLEASEAAREALQAWPEILMALEPSDPRGVRLGALEVHAYRKLPPAADGEPRTTPAFVATGEVGRDGDRDDAALVRLDIGDGELVVEGRIFAGGERGRLTFTARDAEPRVVAW